MRAKYPVVILLLVLVCAIAAAALLLRPRQANPSSTVQPDQKDTRVMREKDED